MKELTDLLIKGKLMDYGSCKGTYVWSYYANLWMNIIEKKYKQLFNDHEIITVPTLCSLEWLKYEKALVGDLFDSNIYITKNFYLKPTSEFPLYLSDFYNKAIKNQNDLPLKYMLYNRVYRKESRATPLLRVNEITCFYEGHSTFIDEKSTIKYMEIVQKRYEKLFEYLKLPYIKMRRFSEDTFPGAKYTIAYDTVFKSGLKIQMGTIHYLGNNYSQILDLETKKKNGDYVKVHQTCYGISERVLGAILYHGFKGDKFELPHILRLKELLVFEEYFKEEFLDIYDKVHIISERKFPRIFKEALIRDSMIYVIGQKEAEKNTVTLHDRGVVDTLFEDCAELFSSEREDVKYILGKPSFKIPYLNLEETKATIPNPEEIWGYDDQYIYGGESY